MRLDRIVVFAAAVAAAVVSVGACRQPTPEHERMPEPLSKGRKCPTDWHVLGFDDRFPVGATPAYRVPAMVGEAAKCHVEIKQQDIVQIEDGQPVLIGEGTFRGGCPGEPPTYKFESVKIEKIVVENGSKQTLPMSSDDHQFFTVYANDRCGFVLRGGHYARWTPGAGCDKVVLVIAEGEGADGVKKPSDTIALRGIGAGTCTLAIDYFGVKGELTIEVPAGEESGGAGGGGSGSGSG